MCNAESSDILWSFIENYYPKLKKEENPLLINMLEYGVQYYNKFVLPNKKYRPASHKEKEGFSLLIDFLKIALPTKNREYSNKNLRNRYVFEV